MKVIRPQDFGEQYKFIVSDLKSPLVLLVRELRTELEYDLDCSPEMTAFGYIKEISKNFVGNIFSVIASQRYEISSRLRSYKGVLPINSALRKLDHRNLDPFATKQYSRLGALISLSKFGYNEEPGLILGWVDSLLVLSRLDIETLSPIVEKWLAQNKKSVLGFDYTIVVNDLMSRKDTAILRYFAADNGKNETIAVVGNEEFVLEEFKDWK